MIKKNDAHLEPGRTHAGDGGGRGSENKPEFLNNSWSSILFYCNVENVRSQITYKRSNSCYFYLAGLNKHTNLDL